MKGEGSERRRVYGTIAGDERSRPACQVPVVLLSFWRRGGEEEAEEGKRVSRSARARQRGRSRQVEQGLGCYPVPWPFVANDVAGN